MALAFRKAARFSSMYNPYHTYTEEVKWRWKKAKGKDRQNSFQNLLTPSSFNLPKQDIGAKSSSPMGNYETALAQRLEQAKRTIIAQVLSYQSQDALFKYCNHQGKVNSMHHYKIPDGRSFVLVEYKDEKAVWSTLECAKFDAVNKIIASKTPVFYFHSDLKGSQNFNTINRERCTSVHIHDTIDDTKLLRQLQDNHNITEQLIHLHRLMKLSDIEIRLRFFTVYHLESFLTRIFPNAKIFPFGSSVNGFGKRNCDLDMVLQINPMDQSTPTGLIFQAKCAPTDPFRTKDFLSCVASVMRSAVPGVTRVMEILHARVPIIKFNQTYTNIECDFSVSNKTALYMSELLYTYGEFDERVRPIVFFIRLWASVHELSRGGPGPWITNFSLTLLVLFYLQSKTIIPSLDVLRTCALYTDIRIINKVDCTFLRDLDKLPNKYRTQNKDTLETLLRGFFEFYATFEFNSHAVSIREGHPVPKPDSGVLHICNPLETSLNVSKNVNFAEVARFQAMAHDMIYILSGVGENAPCSLLSLFPQNVSKRLQKFTVTKGGTTTRQNVRSKTFLSSLPKHDIDKSNGEATEAVVTAVKQY